MKNLKQYYNDNGFVIIRNLFDSKFSKEIENHVKWLQNKHPNIRPEAFHHHLLVHDPFIHHVIGQEKMLDVVSEIIGPNIALFGAHYIAKKPIDGRPVGWHQDGSYWPLQPMNVVSVWLAGTASKKENACMRVVPGSQNKRLLKPSDMMKMDTEKYVLDLAIHPDQINDSNAIDIELEPGDISIHNPFIVHGSNANISKFWRIGLTLRFIPTTTFVNSKKWECVLLRGKKDKNIQNNYINRPVFKENEHMPFNGSKNY